MVSQTALRAGNDGWQAIAALVDADGSARHPHRRRLCAPAPNARDLSDAVHALCTIHGNHPGIADCALGRGVQPGAGDWLLSVATGFAAERAFLAQLNAAVGPLPSTPGQAESEAALGSQRHTLDMLAGSDRAGCSTGGVIALALDWPAIRVVLAAAATRFGIDTPTLDLPGQAATAAAVAEAGATPGAARALGFGAQQLLAQHRGLWDLLEARASARAG